MRLRLNRGVASSARESSNGRKNRKICPTTDDPPLKAINPHPAKIHLSVNKLMKKASVLHSSGGTAVAVVPMARAAAKDGIPDFVIVNTAHETGARVTFASSGGSPVGHSVRVPKMSPGSPAGVVKSTFTTGLYPNR